MNISDDKIVAVGSKNRERLGNHYSSSSIILEGNVTSVNKELTQRLFAAFNISNMKLSITYHKPGFQYTFSKINGGNSVFITKISNNHTFNKTPSFASSQTSC